MPRAEESTLANLHEVVAQEMIDRIRGGEATPSDIRNAIAFLKDNGITVKIKPDEGAGSDLLRLTEEEIADNLRVANG